MVSRAAMRLNVSGIIPVYFRQLFYREFQNKILKYDGKKKELSLVKDPCLTIDNQYTIQVRFDIYGLNINSTKLGWFRYSNLTSGQVWKTALPNPRTVRRYPSLVNFCNDYIFVIGG